MRIVVVSPPRSGNHWVKCLLGQVYGLEWRGGNQKPATRAAGFREDVALGGFPDGAIMHQHCRYSRKLADEFERLPAHVVSVVRDPYDTFVSYYHWVQVRKPQDEAAAEKAAGRPRSAMLGKPIDDPEVLGYLSGEFGANLAKGDSWLASGRSLVVRFEDLNREPVAALAALTDQIAPVDHATLERAIEACNVENVKQERKKLARTVRSGRVGDSRQTLGPEHLALFRERHADLIERLGYEVR